MHWFFYVQTCETHGKCVENMVFCRFHCCFLELWQFMGMQSRENYILWMQKYPFSNEECCETQWKLYQKAENAENGRKPKKHMIFFFNVLMLFLRPIAMHGVYSVQFTEWKPYMGFAVNDFCCNWGLGSSRKVVKLWNLSEKFISCIHEPKSPNPSIKWASLII